MCNDSDNSFAKGGILHRPQLEHVPNRRQQLNELIGEVAISMARQLFREATQRTPVVVNVDPGLPLVISTQANPQGETEIKLSVRQLRKVLGVDRDLTDEAFLEELDESEVFRFALYRLFGEP